MMDDNLMAYMAGQNENGRNNGIFGGDGLWGLIIILALLGGFGGGFGFGGFGGGMMFPWMMMPWMMGGWGRNGDCATQADLAAGFNNSAVLNNLNDLKLGQAGVQQTMCQGFSGLNNTVNQGINEISHQISDCCCQTQRAIDGVNYNMATGLCNLQNTMNNNTRDIIDSQQAGTRAILDFLTQDKIATLTAENQALRFSASQDRQNAYLTTAMQAQTNQLLGTLDPRPVPSYQVPNPNCCYRGGGCGCGQVGFNA